MELLMVAEEKNPTIIEPNQREQGSTAFQPNGRARAGVNHDESRLAITIRVRILKNVWIGGAAN